MVHQLSKAQIISFFFFFNKTLEKENTSLYMALSLEEQQKRILNQISAQQKLAYNPYVGHLAA